MPAVLCLLLLMSLRIVAQQDLTRFVDPLIGTGGHGHTFPGASMPFGMVQLSPDTRLTGWDGCSGYHYSDHIIYGFSHTHLSGTGISDYGDILLMPTVNEVSLTDRGYAASFNHSNESARAGYYGVKLDNGILVELVATLRAGFHRYTYPQSNARNIVLDLAHRDRVLDSSLRVVDATHLEGFRRSSAWAKDQVVYFVAEFSQPPRDTTIYKDDREIEGKDARGNNLKAVFRFAAKDEAAILVKVGISAVSIEGARKNLAAEIPNWDFSKVREDADIAWQKELNKIQASGGSEAQLKTFYTALYHTMLAPNLFMDVDGQYRGRDFQTHTARGFENYTVFSLWDTFRAAHPLYTIIDQKRTRDFINTFLAQYQQGGRLPVWELAANETDTMIGYHAVSVIADAAAKGIDGFDLKLAFEAMKHSAELNQSGLRAYTTHGYIELEDEKESVSKTLEYAYDDWCIAQVARMLGRTDDYQRYLRRAQFYQNMFDRDSGFMRPRSNGGWLAHFDPREVSFNFTEANSWQDTFFAPQDITGLISLMGGKDKFWHKLDELFATESKTTGREQADITGLIGQYAHGNEPSHHVAYLYDYIGQSWETQYWVRQIMDKFYTPQPDGLIGNEDCGQMSAWYVLSAAGFYPVTPGSPIYAIGTPLFPEIRFRLESGKEFVIKANGVSGENIYIQSATLNGRPHPIPFLTHRDLMAGGQLVFEMGPRPSFKWNWDLDASPSHISDNYFVPTPVIKTSGKTFKDRLEVSMDAAPLQERYTEGFELSVLIGNKLEIHYTTDGSEPNRGSTLFTQPFFIDRTTTVKARAFDAAGASLVASGTFHKISRNWTIKLLSKYNRQYPAGGDGGLIDGVRGSSNFGDGAWQGYQGQDLIAIVDLGNTQNVSKLGAGFLQNVESWIWMPRSVDFELSTDGVNFVRVLSVNNEVSDKDFGAIVKDLVGTFSPRPARYVRVTAHTYGKIPAWHPGAGDEAFIFADEIIIE
ncbi:MAG TPA: GH92 family glycosyl hydrolase [Pyrinomonadaceae bacterium]|nr:GH92 family glycosyl hydrolase [Pyrinomonadaceae bacterium]